MIFPPILQSTQPAFLASSDEYIIYMSLQSITSYSEIGHVQIRLVRQSNNRAIVDTSLYPDGIIYKPATALKGVTGTSQYYIQIQTSDLAEKWQAGYLYKIQVRFGTTAMYSSISDFANWKQQQIDDGTFSEWSTVMVIKAINKPEVSIGNAEAFLGDIIESEQVEPTLMPLFLGIYSIDSSSREAEDKYKFDLYSGEQEQLIETSGWLQHNSAISTNDEYRFSNILTNNQYYTVIYTIQTINGYEQASDPYYFVVTQSYFGDLQNVTIETQSDRDNGRIQIYLTSQDELIGNFVITRSSEKSNYGVWEDLYYFPLAWQRLNNSLIYTDYTVESGIRYRYAIQQENDSGMRTLPVISSTCSVNLEYGYLYRDGVQLRLSLNESLSSFKYTTLRSKQDTLGGKYPVLVENGNAYYAEFPISGMISFQMDEDSTFFTYNANGCYYKGELVIPMDKMEQDVQSRGDSTLTKPFISTDLSDNNVFVERIFRQKVEEFLNDFNYKLYRSPTEGNIVVGLINVSLTPNTTVGRMLYNFSANAYEVMEATLDNLNEFGIVTRGEDTSLSDSISEETVSFGQISGLFSAGTDFMELINEQQERDLGNGYSFVLDNVKSFTIERYPNINLEGEIAVAGDSEEGLALQELQEAIRSNPGVFFITVDNNDILVPANQQLTFDSGYFTELLLVTDKVPLIINYTCGLRLVETSSQGTITAVTSTRVWNQISGVFTSTDEVLTDYDYNYLDSETYRIYNPYPDDTVIYDDQGNVLVDNTNYNVYKTTDLLDAIKEDAKKWVELLYDTKFELDSNGYYTNGQMYYQFGDITSFEIEADEGTDFILNGSTRIQMDSTNILHLNPADNMIRSIELTSPQYCVINYKCTCTLMTRGS